PLTIVLASCHKLLDVAVRSTATSCLLLESLDMSNFLCVSDETLREIALICGHLHILNASYCPNISLESVRLLMLIVLKLHSCEGITSASMAATSHSYMLEVYKEMQATLTIVANRKFTVLRTCLQIDQGTWVIAELSHVRAPNTYRRLPSGCLIEHITGDVSKVTCVEHMEVDEPLPNRSGFAFAAERMVAWLERSCERGSHMNATCHIEDPCYEGKDFRDVVMTPALLLMCEYLTLPITFGRDMAIGSFVSSVVLSMEREGYTIECDYLQSETCQRGSRQSSNGVKAFFAGTNNAASLSSSTHNMRMKAEGGGSSMPSPSSPITDAINSLIHTSDESHSQQQSQWRLENMMAPGNVVGTGQNIDGSNSMVGGQASRNVRSGAPRAGRLAGASPLAILNPNPMEMNKGSTSNTTSIQDIKPRIAQRKPSD
ncbi:homeobox-leucine zipper protein HDG11, partial [Tanacetum coccineum]